MELRITPQITVSNAVYNAQQQTNQLATLQQEASTGITIQQPSDNPIGAMQVLADQTQNSQLSTYQQNVSDAQAKLNSSVSTLNQVSNLLTQAKDLALQGSNTTNTPTAYLALGSQVNSILNEVIQLANTQQNGEYLYGGTASTQTTPFTVNGQGQVAYNGASQGLNEPIGQGQNVQTLYAGNQVFQSTQRGATVYAGTTGAAAGSGTDSATGSGTLLVTHTSTTYAAGSGVQPGTNSAAGDTILGPSGTHTLTLVDTSGIGSGGTIQLDNGPTVQFTNTDTNLQVQGPNGELVYLNTTAIAAGFSGKVAITSNGALSTDGGLSSVPITYSGNQVVTNGQTGAVTNVNSTNIAQTGTDQLSYTGTYDVFQILSTLRDTLNNTTLPSGEQASAVSQTLQELDRVNTGVLNTVGQQSASLQNLQGLSQHIQDLKLQTNQQIGNIQNADITQVVLGLQQQQNLLQATLYSASHILSLSLMDFLH